MPAIRLGELARVHRALGLTGAVLIGFTLIDVLIALDFRLGEGRNAASIVTRASLPMLLFVGYGASVAGVGRAARIGHATSAATTGNTVPAPASPSVESGRIPPDENGSSPEQDDPTIMDTVRAALHRDGLFRDPDLTLERIARRSGVPARRVSGAINRTTGDSVSRYLSRLRLDEVRQRLVASDDSVTEVMLAAGFRTKSNFNRVLREAERCSPTEWRIAQR